MSYRNEYDLSPRARGDSAMRARTVCHIVYALYAVSLFTAGLSVVVGGIVAYVLRGQTAGTFYRSHIDYLIRTFWGAVVVGAIGWTLVWVVIGWPILGVLWLWILYRVVKGWIRLSQDQPI